MGSGYSVDRSRPEAPRTEGGVDVDGPDTQEAGVPANAPDEDPGSAAELQDAEVDPPPTEE